MSKLPRSSVLNVPTFRSSITTVKISRGGRPITSTSSSARRFSRAGAGICEFHLANDGATSPVEESCVLLGVAQLIDAGPELAGHHGGTVAVANLHDVRL